MNISTTSRYMRLLARRTESDPVLNVFKPKIILLLISSRTLTRVRTQSTHKLLMFQSPVREPTAPRKAPHSLEEAMNWHDAQKLTEVREDSALVMVLLCLLSTSKSLRNLMLRAPRTLSSCETILPCPSKTRTMPLLIRRRRQLRQRPRSLIVLEELTFCSAKAQRRIRCRRLYALKKNELRMRTRS